MATVPNGKEQRGQGVRRMNTTNVVIVPHTMTTVITARNALPLANIALTKARPDIGMHFPLIWAARSFRYSRIVIAHCTS